MKIKLITFLLFVCSITLTKAQGDIEDLVKGGAADANYLIQGYSEPLLKAVGYGLNQGWYNTAKPHKIAGVDITVPISLITIPSKATTFQIDNARLTQLERLSGPGGTVQSGPAQTLFGSDKTTTLRMKSNPSNEISLPGGLNLKDEIGINAVPLPMAQLGFGLPKGTDLKLRFVPKTDIGDDGSVNMFGVGVMHDVKQWIPVIKNIPFDLSGFVGYTKLKIDFATGSGASSGSAKYEVSATTIQALISKKLSVLTVYAGLGANIANTDLSMTGRFDTDDDTTTPDQTMTISAKAASSGPRATIGMRLKLAVLTIHGDYTLQGYNALNVGIGISVR
jgi:hypothetical protein